MIILTAGFFQPFCVFLHENNTKHDDFNTFRNLREGAAINISWEKMTKKEGPYPKGEFDTDRLQKIADRLQNSVMDQKRLQNLLIDNRRLEKLYMDYKVY